MGTHLLLISDTHARELPAQVWSAVAAADLVVHAGDWTDEATLDALTTRAARLVGVYGNNDGPVLRSRLPEIARVQVEGLRLVVVHETGAAKAREARCASRFPDDDVLIFGHSHVPWDSVTATGLRLLNPGSPTDRRRQPHGSYLTAVADRGRLGEVALHPVPR